MALMIVTSHFVRYVRPNVSHAQEQQITANHARQIGIHLQHVIATSGPSTITALATIVTTNA